MTKKTKKAIETVVIDANNDEEVMEQREALDEITVTCRATAPDGTKFDKSFKGSRAPIACVLVQTTDENWRVLGWTSNKTRALSHVNRVRRSYMQTDKAPEIELRYLDVKNVQVRDVKEIEHKEDRSFFSQFSASPRVQERLAKLAESKEAKSA